MNKKEVWQPKSLETILKGFRASNIKSAFSSLIYEQSLGADLNQKTKIKHLGVKASDKVTWKKIKTNK